jgi:hypothetical protein
LENRFRRIRKLNQIGRGFGPGRGGSVRRALHASGVPPFDVAPEQDLTLIVPDEGEISFERCIVHRVNPFLAIARSTSTGSGSILPAVVGPHNVDSQRSLVALTFSVASLRVSLA